MADIRNDDGQGSSTSAGECVIGSVDRLEFEPFHELAIDEWRQRVGQYESACGVIDGNRRRRMGYRESNLMKTDLDEIVRVLLYSSDYLPTAKDNDSAADVPDYLTTLLRFSDFVAPFVF